MLDFDEINNIVISELDCLDPKIYQFVRDPRGQTTLYTVTKSGNIIGRYRVAKRPDGGIVYGSIYGDSPEWNLIWESMLCRTIQRAEGTMTETMEKHYQTRQEFYFKQIQEQAVQLDSEKPETSQVVDDPGFEIRGIWQLPVDWDVLVSASESCLDGYSSGFVNKEIIPEKKLPASITYRIWQNDLGELGTVEIRKLREGLSQIYISGVPLGAESLPDWDETSQKLQGEQREIIIEALIEKHKKEKARRAQLKNHQAKVIKSYFSRLKQEQIWQDAQELVISGDRQESTTYQKSMDLVCDKREFRDWFERQYPAHAKYYKDTSEGAIFSINTTNFNLVYTSENGRYKYIFAVTEPSGDPKIRVGFISTVRNTFEIPEREIGTAKPEKLPRKELLDQACVEWVSRDSHGYLGRYTREEFLEDFQEKTGEVITKDEFRRALEDARKREIIENINGRLKPKTRP